MAPPGSQLLLDVHPLIHSLPKFGYEPGRVGQMTVKEVPFLKETSTMATTSGYSTHFLGVAALEVGDLVRIGPLTPLIGSGWPYSCIRKRLANTHNATQALGFFAAASLTQYSVSCLQWPFFWRRVISHPGIIQYPPICWENNYQPVLFIQSDLFLLN